MPETGYPATESFKELPKVASGPAAGGSLAFSLVPGDVFRIGTVDYLVTQIVSMNEAHGTVLTMHIECLDGTYRRSVLSKGGITTRGAMI